MVQLFFSYSFFLSLFFFPPSVRLSVYFFGTTFWLVIVINGSSPFAASAFIRPYSSLDDVLLPL